MKPRHLAMAAALLAAGALVVFGDNTPEDPVAEPGERAQAPAARPAATRSLDGSADKAPAILRLLERDVLIGENGDRFNQGEHPLFGRQDWNPPPPPPPRQQEAPPPPPTAWCSMPDPPRPGVRSRVPGPAAHRPPVAPATAGAASGARSGPAHAGRIRLRTELPAAPACDADDARRSDSGHRTDERGDVSPRKNGRQRQLAAVPLRHLLRTRMRRRSRRRSRMHAPQRHLLTRRRRWVCPLRTGARSTRSRMRSALEGPEPPSQTRTAGSARPRR